MLGLRYWSETRVSETPRSGASHCVRHQVCKPPLLVLSLSRLTQPQRRQPSSHLTSRPSAPTTYLASKPWSATFTQRPVSQSKPLGWQPSKLATSHLGQGSPTRMPPNIALLLTGPSKVTWPSLARMSAPPSPNHPSLLPHLRCPHNLTKIRSHLPLQYAPQRTQSALIAAASTKWKAPCVVGV